MENLGKNTPLAIVILAAGKGTRMKSAQAKNMPKVLHKIAGLPMLGHVIKTAENLAPEKIIIVAAPDQVDAFKKVTGAHEIVVQKEQLGTGHAVRCAESALKNFTGDVLVLYGDVPLITMNTLHKMQARMSEPTEPKLIVLANKVHDASGFGRLVTDGELLLRIVEEKDATPEERKIKLINSGVILCRAADLWQWLSEVEPHNAQNEYYLTDIAAMAAKKGKAIYQTAAFMGEVMGVNERWQLAEVEYYWQQGSRHRHMANGVTLQGPQTIFFSHDTQIAADVTIGANVVFGPGVAIESGVEILPFCHLENCTVKSGARVGPFARIRPGTVIGKDARIGNFVEIKNSNIGEGVKANHLSYIGDADIGTEANIGAGAITCNYDGINKYRTEIGRGAFIGSNSALVAPIIINEGAMIGAGSVITKDVPPGALATARAPQRNLMNWATKFFKSKT